MNFHSFFSQNANNFFSSNFFPMWLKCRFTIPLVYLDQSFFRWNSQIVGKKCCFGRQQVGVAESMQFITAENKSGRMSLFVENSHMNSIKSSPAKRNPNRMAPIALHSFLTPQGSNARSFWYKIKFSSLFEIEFGTRKRSTETELADYTSSERAQRSTSDPCNSRGQKDLKYGLKQVNSVKKWNAGRKSRHFRSFLDIEKWNCEQTTACVSV